MRLTIHEDKDCVVREFFAAQPSRGYSDAVRLLIHFFVSEYGYRDVVGALGEHLVALNATNPQRQSEVHIPQTTEQQAVDQPQLSFEPSPVAAEAGAPVRPVQPPETAEDAHDLSDAEKSQSQSQEMDDIFGSLRGKKL